MCIVRCDVEAAFGDSQVELGIFGVTVFVARGRLALFCELAGDLIEFGIFGVTVFVILGRLTGSCEKFACEAIDGRGATPAPIGIPFVLTLGGILTEGCDGKVCCPSCSRRGTLLVGTTCSYRLESYVSRSLPYRLESYVSRASRIVVGVNGCDRKGSRLEAITTAVGSLWTVQDCDGGVLCIHCGCDSFLFNRKCNVLRFRVVNIARRMLNPQFLQDCSPQVFLFSRS